MEEIWPEPTVAELRKELRRQVKSIERQMLHIQENCKHTNKDWDAGRDWDGDTWWKCIDCEVEGYSRL